MGLLDKLGLVEAKKSSASNRSEFTGKREKVKPENPYLGRQPIINKGQALIGYELFFYPGTEEKARQENAKNDSIIAILKSNPKITTEEAIAAVNAEFEKGSSTKEEENKHVFISEIRYALKDKGVGASLGHHLGFIKLDPAHLDENISSIPPQIFVLEISPDFFVDPNPELTQALFDKAKKVNKVVEVAEVVVEEELTEIEKKEQKLFGKRKPKVAFGTVVKDEEEEPEEVIPLTYEEQVFAKLDPLISSGFQFALGGLTEITDGLDEILKRCRYAKLDINKIPEENLAPLIEYCNKHLKQPEVRKGKASKKKEGAAEPVIVRVIAEKVETKEDFDRAFNAGLDGFQGFYFTKKGLGQESSLHRGDDYLRLLKLLALLLTGPSLEELNLELLDNPVVARQLIKIARKEGEKKRREVYDLRDAVSISGIKKITRWTQVLLYADGDGKVELEDSPLLEAVCVRALFMEYSAARINNAGNLAVSDLAFLVGGLSLIENVFDLTIDEILANFELPNMVNDAIKYRSGVLGELLSLAEAAEVGDLQKCKELCVGNLEEISMDSIAVDNLHAIKSFSSQVKEAPDEDVWADDLEEA
jgi:c-di-GMP-related signal transduction protein